MSRGRGEDGLEAGSFRDRHGRIVYADGRVLRYLSESALKNWRALSQKKFMQAAMAAGRVVRTEEVSTPAQGPAIWRMFFSNIRSRISLEVARVIISATRRLCGARNEAPA